MPPMFFGPAWCLEIGLEQLNLSEAYTGSVSRQLSQLADGGSLSRRIWPIFPYVLSCFGLWLPGSVLASF
jgi:hypothetical protein